MKTFLTTMKGKVIAGIATVGAIGAIAAVILVMNSGYRTIAVEALNGITQIVNKGVTGDAYVGQHLKSGDDVTVTEHSDLTLALDTDKFVFAKEHTHFWVEATGKKADTQTKIHLDEGSTLCRIDQKLTSSENFDVETPNATMSVRGTVFRVFCYKDDTGDTYTVIEVLEGEVYVQVKMEAGQNTDESRLLQSGEAAIVRSNKDFSEFVKSADDENKESDDKNTDKVIQSIDFTTFTQNEALFLGKAIEEGRTLCITKDLLYDIAELTEHDFSGKSEEVAATCEEDGYYYEICSVCGIQGEKHITSNAHGHKFIAKDGDENVKVCKICGKTIKGEPLYETEEEEPEQEDFSEEPGPSTEETASMDDIILPDATDPCAKGHSFAVISSTSPTCTAAGATTEKCSRCGFTRTTASPAKGHYFVKESSTPATCKKAGTITEKCRNCGAVNTYENEDEPALGAKGHSFVEVSSVAATCTKAGTITKKCKYCGTKKTLENASDPAKGHSYVKVSSTPATCTKAGTITEKCSRCEDTKTSENASDPAKGHSLKYVSTQLAYHHMKCCENCDYSVEEQCTPGAWCFDETEVSDSGLHWQLCTLCNQAATQSTEHSFDSTPVPSLNEYMHEYRCICGYCREEKCEFFDEAGKPTDTCIKCGRPQN